eukprot:CAMPEP_0206577808 /NCGR_PEP_ID=MMETSP0325_2-20121206/31586_1 /ASSEMBLY_ACC=CAM_ASM_000347 /TAXON_ID=2866 /ORGANISM="Crypthecodinium cohnii, Strain Seligo" /LENGTH=151 /DNA_ID=CAMNT_0054083323 /DNA_START=152 /DNA_END=607 /DNA_ORIENTATION=-
MKAMLPNFVSGSSETLNSVHSDARALKAVADFCQHYEASHIIPSSHEMHRLWAVCSSASAAAIAAGLRGQLLPPAGGAVGGFWAPRLRALHLLEYFCWQGGSLGLEVFNLVIIKASRILHRLAEGPPLCREQAKRVLALQDLGLRPEKISL